jgi:hypothetical protein
LERTFLITVIEQRTAQIDQSFIIKGETLYKAILSELIANAGCFLWWTPDMLGEDTSPEEKAVTCLTMIETGDCCDYEIAITDITDHNNLYLIFPKDKRPEKFDPMIIGKKFYINCWIPVHEDPEDRPSFTSLVDAETELEQLKLMQPENIYRIEGE